LTSGFSFVVRVIKWRKACYYYYYYYIIIMFYYEWSIINILHFIASTNVIHIKKINNYFLISCSLCEWGSATPRRSATSRSRT
jgi:hypothetical protein